MELNGSRRKRWMLITVAAGALVVAAIAIMLLSGGDNSSGTVEIATTTTAIETTPEPGSTEGDRRSDQSPNESGGRSPERDDTTGKPATAAQAEREARRTYERYIASINAEDGARLCALIAPGFEQALDPPAERSNCARTLSASIGFERRGFPVWERTVLGGIESINLSSGASKAQLTADILTEFSDRTEPSFESDIAYLELTGGDWRLAKASGALYRAVGKPDFPPSVVSPPRD